MATKKPVSQPTTMYLLLPLMRMMPDTLNYKPYGIEYNLSDYKVLVELPADEVISADKPIEFRDQRSPDDLILVAYNEAILTPEGVARVAIEIAKTINNLHWAYDAQENQS